MKLFSMFPYDKLAHNLVGFGIVTAVAIAAITSGVASSYVNQLLAVLAGWLIARFAGSLKESYDSAHPTTNTADLFDAEATTAGASLAAAAWIVGLMVFYG